jgi:hypothetical protein
MTGLGSISATEAADRLAHHVYSAHGEVRWTETRTLEAAGVA